MKKDVCVFLFFLGIIHSFCYGDCDTLLRKNKGNEVKSIGMIGEGAWGIAIASLLAENGYHVSLWCCEKDVAQQINKEHVNSRYMPGYELSPNIVAHVDLKDVACHNWVFISTPTKFFRDVVTKCKSYYRMNQRWVILSKGIENETLMLPSQILEHVLSSRIHYAVLGGPSFAHGVMDKSVTGVNIAASDHSIAEDVAVLVRNSWFRPFVIDDVLGLQLGGALKNVVALLMGIVKGLNGSDNTRAFLFTRAWQEMCALSIALGAQEKTLFDLAGLGDLFLTASGGTSRNFAVGKLFGRGYALTRILDETGFTPEGLNTIKTVQELTRKYDLVLPLAQQLYQVIFKGKTVSSLIDVVAHESAH
jgi:glycerol-3-phosphate dehydrogenase (NAD(P)+)